MAGPGRCKAHRVERARRRGGVFDREGWRCGLCESERAGLSSRAEWRFERLVVEVCHARGVEVSMVIAPAGALVRAWRVTIAGGRGWDVPVPAGMSPTGLRGLDHLVDEVVAAHRYATVTRPAIVARRAARRAHRAAREEGPRVP